jgi:predicted aldo/keto reductase-like oxidoreductase
VPREQLHITTKLPPTPDADLMRQWIDESLERLQLDYLDCLAIHGINTWEHLAWVESQMAVCRLCKKLCQGRVRQSACRAGLSAYGFLTSSCNQAEYRFDLNF